MAMLLFDEQPLVLSKKLAKLIGLNEAIVLQQVHFWVELNKKANKNFHKGRYWTYNSFPKWQEEHFYFWGIATVKRIFSHLVNLNLLLVDRFNDDPRDQTNWYTINYDELERLNNIIEEVPSYQNDTMGESEDILCENTQDEYESPIVSNWYDGEYQNDTMENTKLIRCIKTKNNPTKNNNTYINPPSIVNTCNTSEEAIIEFQGLDLTQTEYIELLGFIEYGKTKGVSKQSTIDWYKEKQKNKWQHKGENVKDRQKLFKSYVFAINKNFESNTTTEILELPSYYKLDESEKEVSGIITPDFLEDLKFKIEKS